MIKKRFLIKNYIIDKCIENHEGIQIYILNIIGNSKHINMGIIPQAQINEISQYKIKIERDKRLLARSFLYQLLNEYYGITNFDLDFTEYKKPFLKEAPNIGFSFSYSGDYVLLGISDRKEVGVDIEHINPNLMMNELASTIMCEEELVKFYFYGSDLLTQRIYFFKLFSAKEAIIKAFGTGLFYDIKKLNILNSNLFTHNNITFVHHGFRLWKDQYSLSICYEQ